MEIIDRGMPRGDFTGSVRLFGRSVLIRKLDTPVLEYHERTGTCQMMYYIVLEFNNPKQSAWLWDGWMVN